VIWVYAHTDDEKSISNEDRITKLWISSKKFSLHHHHHHSIMKSFTSSSQNKRQKTDTIKKTRFFHVIDTRISNVTIKDVCETKNVNHDTKKLWLKQRKRLNVAVSRRMSKFRSDRFKKMSSELMNEMLDSQKNSMRDYSWSVQVEHFNLNIASRTLRASFNQRHSRVSRFKKTRITSLNNKNKQLRVEYVKKHKTHIIDNFW
jgi:hypothetical protein